MRVGDEVIDANGDLWTVLTAPCQIPGAESDGLFRRETPAKKRGRQQYGRGIPGPLVWMHVTEGTTTT